MKRIFSLNIATFIIGFIAILSYITINSMISSYDWVNHTYEVILQIERIKDDVSDSQVSIREFVFNGEERYLDTYYNKYTGLEAQMDNLQWLTRDNPTQQKNVYELRLNVYRKLSSFKQALQIYKDKGKKPSQEFVSLGFGETQFESIREIKEKMESEELRLLAYRISDAKYKSGIVLYGIPLLLILYVAVSKYASSVIPNFGG